MLEVLLLTSWLAASWSAPWPAPSPTTPAQAPRRPNRNHDNTAARRD